MHPLQQALKDLERAWTNCFAGRAALPRFRKRGCGDSFRYPDAKQIHLDEPKSRIFLPKLDWLRYRKSREIQGRVKNVTVSLSCDRWFLSIQTEREVSEPVHPCGPESAVGIDLGIVRFATFSDGAFPAPLKSFTQHEKALRKAQQRLPQGEIEQELAESQSQSAVPSCPNRQCSPGFSAQGHKPH